MKQNWHHIPTVWNTKDTMHFLSSPTKYSKSEPKLEKASNERTFYKSAAPNGKNFPSFFFFLMENDSGFKDIRKHEDFRQWVNQDYLLDKWGRYWDNWQVLDRTSGMTGCCRVHVNLLVLLMDCSCAWRCPHFLRKYILIRIHISLLI